MSQERLDATDWNGRCGVVVIDPELESWVWSDSVQVDHALGWDGRIPALRAWLTDEGFAFNSQGKPDQPKDAMEAALKSVGKPRSSAVFAALAARVSLSRCVDPSFVRFKELLKGWFSDDA